MSLWLNAGLAITSPTLKMVADTSCWNCPGSRCLTQVGMLGVIACSRESFVHGVPVVDEGGKLEGGRRPAQLAGTVLQSQALTWLQFAFKKAPVVYVHGDKRPCIMGIAWCGDRMACAVYWPTCKRLFCRALLCVNARARITGHSGKQWPIMT